MTNDAGANDVPVARANEFFRFALTGVGAFLVDALFLTGFLALGAGFYVGRLLSWLAAATFSWRINRQWTFRAVTKSGAWREWLRFLLANAVGGLVNFSVYALSLHWVSGLRELPVIAVAAGSVAGLAINYSLSRCWVFHGRRSP